MKKVLTLSLTVALGLGLSGAANALSITADGDLSDWGLHQSSNSNDWIPKNGVFYTVEDYTKGYDGGWVNPGWGGQAYDAEALYVTWDNASLYIALVTGHDPGTSDNPSGNTFGPGDFALAFWDGTGSPVYTYGIETTGNHNLSQGDVYAVTDWFKSPYWGGTYITSIKTGVRTGTADSVISKAPITGIGEGSAGDKHWVYELSVPWTAFNFASGSKLSVSWTMNCANDMIEVDPSLRVTRVDEPPLWALLSLTLPSLLRRRRS